MLSVDAPTTGMGALAISSKSGNDTGLYRVACFLEREIPLPPSQLPAFSSRSLVSQGCQGAMGPALPTAWPIFCCQKPM